MEGTKIEYGEPESKRKLLEMDEKKLIAELLENKATRIQYLRLCVVKDGVVSLVGQFTAYQVLKGQAMEAIFNVFPSLAVLKEVSELKKKLKEDLLEAFRELQITPELETWNIKDVHKQMVAYIKENATPGLMEYGEKDGVCRIDYEYVKEVLMRLDIPWKRLEFAKMLARQNMLHAGNDRVAKKLTLPDGTTQYRGLEFDIEFKAVTL